MNNVATLRTANLPPAFYCWGTRDGFAGQFTQNSNAVGEAGCYVETHILQGYPHGYGTGGSASVWCNDFDAFLMKVKRGETTSVRSASAPMVEGQTQIYGMDGRQVHSTGSVHGAYVVKTGQGSRKVMFAR